MFKSAERERVGWGGMKLAVIYFSMWPRRTEMGTDKDKDRKSVGQQAFLKPDRTDEATGKKKSSSTVNGNINQFIHYGNQYGGPQKL